MNFNDLAELIFPNIKETISDLENKFPLRKLKLNEEVTRFAPSPTGFLHTGSLFTAFIAYKIAKQSHGIFILRIEDTDTKREIQGSSELLIKQLNEFDININEGVLLGKEIGNYGPYIQSKRKYIYHVVIKEMIKNGLAYPCFCSKEELNALREYQEKNKIITGYYGEYAKCRNLSIDEAYNKIKNGEKFVIRFKSNGNHNNKITIFDEIRGELSLSENDQDIVILKSDDLPTYHFAHIVDDHFMHTTLVTRGEEWLASLPIHIQLFNALNFKAPKYAHLPVIMKVDEEGKKRKLSKRKDKEAAVDYFLKLGYPIPSILTYLMSIANSNFEEYLISNNNQNVNYDTFTFSLNKMSLDGALFDLEKLNYFSKEYLASLNKDEITKLVIDYSKKYNENLFNLVNSDINYFKEIINIEREKDKPRKDFSNLAEIYDGILYFYNDFYIKNISKSIVFFKNQDFIKAIPNMELIKYLKDLQKDLKFENITEQEWFNSLKSIAESNNFCTNNKEYKINPNKYNGNTMIASQILRYVITLKFQSPNLYNILCILKKDEVKKRISLFINELEN